MSLKREVATFAPVEPTHPRRTVSTVNRREVSTVSETPETLVPGLGNVTAKDIVVPRLKLLQGLSPEVQDDPRRNIQGEFFHTVLAECIGTELSIVPLQINRSIELWAPRDDERGVLARSADGVHWDKPHQKFEVRIDNKKVIWDTKGSVGESGLAEFGTSKPGDARSAPVASLTYRVAMYSPEHEDWGPILFITSKTAVRPTMDFISRINLRHMGGVPFYCQQYKLVSALQSKGSNQWYLPAFRNDGNITDKEMCAYLESLSKGMATMNIRSNDDRLDDELPRESRASEARY